MDISNIASVGCIEVDTDALVGVLLRSYILSEFSDNRDKCNGSIFKLCDTDIYELHYEVYDHQKQDYNELVQQLSVEQSRIIAAFDVVRNAVKSL